MKEITIRGKDDGKSGGLSSLVKPRDIKYGNENVN